MKQYIGFSRDHSGSMRLLAKAAARDYNDTIAAIKDAALTNNIDTIVSTVKCGVGGVGAVIRETVNSSIAALQPVPEHDYRTDGGSTPLFDSVGELISIFETVPDFKNPDVSFLINTITDGQENSSRSWSGSQLGRRIKELQASDRWTFVFRVPGGYKQSLVSLGIPEGNIFEWEQTERGMAVASQANREAVRGYYQARSLGAKSTRTFYDAVRADLKSLNVNQLKASAMDITSEITIYPVSARQHDIEIFDFLMKARGSVKKGCGFYELMKSEAAVQSNKQVIIRNLTTGCAYTGPGARAILGLPDVGTVRMAPGEHGNYDIFIQSTSTNRKLKAGQRVVYWPAAQ